MNLQQLKQEAREGECTGPRCPHEIAEEHYVYTAADLDTLIDKVVDAVEASVVPECIDPQCDGRGTTMDSQGEPEPCEFCHRERLHLLEAFRNFRGV